MILQSLLLLKLTQLCASDGAKTAIRAMEGRRRRKSFTRREDAETWTALVITQVMSRSGPCKLTLKS